MTPYVPFEPSLATRVWYVLALASAVWLTAVGVVLAWVLWFLFRPETKTEARAPLRLLPPAPRSGGEPRPDDIRATEAQGLASLVLAFLLLGLIYAVLWSAGAIYEAYGWYFCRRDVSWE